MSRKKVRMLGGFIAASMLMSQMLVVSAEDTVDNQSVYVEQNMGEVITEEPIEAEETTQGADDVEEPQKGIWVFSSGKWWYCYGDGSYPAGRRCEIDGKTYAFDKDGWMVTGWYQEGADWFCFETDGSMKTGWLQEKGVWYYLNPSDGVMYADGNYEIDGKTYLFNISGAMKTGWVNDKNVWKYYDDSGAMHKGWMLEKKVWYYLNPIDGAMYASGVFEIDGVSYVFNVSGAMCTGWTMIETDWYYCDVKGAMQTGWIKLDKKWYYLNPEDGKMYADGIKEINGKNYCFNKSGVMVVGWYQYTRSWKDPDTEKAYKYTNWYYCDKDGSMHKEWLQLGNKWYYLDPEKGYRYEGDVYKIGGKNYGFDKAGVMASGWYERTVIFTNPDTGKKETCIEKYYFNTDGTPFNGWISKDGAWYWTDEEGQMCADGIYKTDKGTKFSKFDKDGKWLGYVDDPDKK